LRAIVNKQREAGAARQRLDAERPCPREQVKHARPVERVIIGMDQNIEERLAQPIGGGTDR
jgi:hypothetical protein